MHGTNMKIGTYKFITLHVSSVKISKLKPTLYSGVCMFLHMHFTQFLSDLGKIQ
jgi:hypothetical protein